MRKNRKFYVCLLAIIAFLCLGIGYAALTGTLNINGTISTADAEDLGDLQVYFVKAEDVTNESFTVVCTPELTGSTTSFPQTAGFFTGYKTATLNITNFKDVYNPAAAKFTIVNVQDSTNAVKIGWTSTIVYSGTEVENINHYFKIEGGFADFGSSFDDVIFDTESTYKLHLDCPCLFFVTVTMTDTPPAALTGISITITLTYNAI